MGLGHLWMKSDQNCFLGGQRDVFENVYGVVLKRYSVFAAPILMSWSLAGN